MIDLLLKPRSIAVIGASRNPHKLGNVIFSNILKHHWRGKVYPINVDGQKVYGKRAYQNVIEIPESVDLAIIVIPALSVPSVIRDCGRKGVSFAMIISAGFGEIGPAGKKLENKILNIAKSYRLRIIGPNCLGLIVPALRLNASFADGLPKVGKTAVISQSGAMAVAITDWAISSMVGFSALVSLGNKADLDEQEFLSYFLRDKATRVITMYLENLIGGRSFLRLLKKVTKIKPVIILVPGKSQKTKEAIISHTGSVAGQRQVQVAALKSAGAFVAESLEELFAYTLLFEKNIKFMGKNVAILTNAGGPGILATDAVANTPNLELATISPPTLAGLRKFMPTTAALHNPVDVVGDAPVERYRNALRLLIMDKNINAVIALLTHQYVTDTEKIALCLIEAQKTWPKKIVAASFIGGQGVAKGRELLTKKGLINFPYPEQAVWALSALRQFSLLKQKTRTFPEVASVTTGQVEIVQGKAAERIVGQYTNCLLTSVLASDYEKALRLAKRLGYPLVAKLISRKIVHKTDSQAVKTNIIDEPELRSVLASWQTSFGKRFGKNEGILLQPYRPGQVEVIVGARRDPVFGPYLVVGLGGIFVQSWGEPIIALAPINKPQAEEIILEGLIGKILLSERGQRLPRRRLVELIVGMSKMMLEKPSIVEFDLNPVIMSNEGLWVADVRIVRRK